MYWITCEIYDNVLLDKYMMITYDLIYNVFTCS